MLAALQALRPRILMEWHTSARLSWQQDAPWTLTQREETSCLTSPPQLGRQCQHRETETEVAWQMAWVPILTLGAPQLCFVAVLSRILSKISEVGMNCEQVDLFTNWVWVFDECRNTISLRLSASGRAGMANDRIVFRR